MKRFPIWALERLDALAPGRIIAAAIVLRLVFGFVWVLFVNVPAENVPVDGETWHSAGADGYIQIARTLLLSGEYAFEPGGDPVHNRPPVQVMLLLVFGAWWPSYWFLVWILGSALLSWLMLHRVRALSQELQLSMRAERVALLLVAFHPYLVFISKTTTFINIAALLLISVAVAVLRLRRRPERYATQVGVLSGLGALTHGIFLLLPVIVMPYIARLPGISRRERIAAMLIPIVITGMIVAPWTLRNMRSFDMFIPVVSGNGYHYWKGEAVYFGGDYPMADVYQRATGEEFREMYYGAVDPRMDAVLWEEAKRDMLDRPWRIPQRLMIGSATFFAPWDSSTVKAIVSAALNVPLLVLMLLFLIRSIRERHFTREQFFLCLLLFYVVEAFAFFVAWGSYFTMLLPTALPLLVSLIMRQARHQHPVESR